MMEVEVRADEGISHRMRKAIRTCHCFIFFSCRRPHPLLSVLLILCNRGMSWTVDSCGSSTSRALSLEEFTLDED